MQNIIDSHNTDVKWQCNNVNVGLSNSQLTKLKSATKNSAKETLSSYMIGNSYVQTNHSYKFY